MKKLLAPLAIAAGLAAPAAASAGTPTASWFNQAINTALFAPAPVAAQDCRIVVKEVLVTCTALRHGLAGVNVFRVGTIAVVYGPGMQTVVVHQSCAMVGGMPGVPYRRVCHF